MSHRTFYGLLAAVLAAALLPGCHGGSDGPVNAISGLITGDTYVIPAGETRTAVGDLTIDTTGGIRIDGTLLVQDGVGVALISDGPIVVTGSIKPAPGAALTRATRTRKTVGMFSDDVRLPDPMNTGKPVIAALPGIDLAVACKTANGNVVLYGEISTADGRDAANDEEDGERGGNLEIGTDTAILAASVQNVPNAKPPRTVTIGGSVKLGAGGAGWTETVGYEDDDGYTRDGYGTRGGNGGKIAIEAGTLVTVAATTFAAGNGGAGGSVGTSVKPLTGQNGTAQEELGEALDLIAGAGGEGGSVIVTAPGVTYPDVGVPGNGGDAGSIVAAAGRGGPAGNGGFTSAYLRPRGNPGKRIVNTTEKAAGAYGRAGSITLMSGATGGRSTSPALPGGRGGYVRVGIWESGGVDRELSQDTDYQEVYFSGYASCGRGFDCPHAASGHVPGTDGGTFGSAVTALTGVTKGQARVTIIDSFEGGNGGNGLPPGTGGHGGADKNQAALGADGVDGTKCPEVPATVVTEHEPNNTPQTPTPMGDARIAQGSIATSEDLDHFSVALTPGVYTFTLTTHPAMPPSFWVKPIAGVTVLTQTDISVTIDLETGPASYTVIWGLYGSVGGYKVTITKN